MFTRPDCFYELSLLFGPCFLHQTFPFTVVESVEMNEMLIKLKKKNSFRERQKFTI